MSKRKNDHTNEEKNDHEAHGCCGHRPLKWFICLGLFGMGFLVGPIYLATSIQSIIHGWEDKKHTIVLTGVGEKTIKADEARISLTVSDAGSNREDTMNRLHQHVQKVVDILTSNKIQKDHIKKTNFLMNDSRKEDYINNKELEPFVASQKMVVSTGDVAAVESIQRRILSLGLLSVPTIHCKIEYINNAPNSTKEVISEAVNNAKSIAQKLKTEKGLLIGPLHSIHVHEKKTLSNDEDGQTISKSSNPLWSIPDLLIPEDDRPEKILQAHAKVEYALGE